MLTQSVFNLLYKNPAEIISGSQIAAELNISREMVRKIVEKLKADEVKIDSVSNRGYRYVGGHILSHDLIKSDLKTKIFGQTLEIFDTLDSTNSYLKNLPIVPEGQTAIAAELTAARGRFNREYFTPKNHGLYLSLRFAPKIFPEDLQFITVVAAVAAVRAISSISGKNVDIKWVNDIYYDGRKLCGILTEVIASAENFETLNVVVGFGINTKSVTGDLSKIATGIYDICGKIVSRNDLAAELLNTFEDLYFKFISGGKGEILAEYKSHQMLFGRQVTVHRGGENFNAKVVDMNENAALIVKDKRGTTHTLTAGEVSLKL